MTGGGLGLVTYLTGSYNWRDHADAAVWAKGLHSAAGGQRQTVQAKPGWERCQVRDRFRRNALDAVEPCGICGGLTAAESEIRIRRARDRQAR
jgi:hypothetical protein